MDKPDEFKKGKPVYILLYKALKKSLNVFSGHFTLFITKVKFKLNGVTITGKIKGKGIPIVNVNNHGKMSIGENFLYNSGLYNNMIGRQQPCFFIVGPHAELNIGNNVGISCTAIVCHNNIKIGNNVRIGGGVVIYDTDFHSLDMPERTVRPEIIENVKTSPIEIGNGVFIGAHSIILKGVSIGVNSIIGAGSVVTKSVPANEVWAGNPARFVKKIPDSQRL